MRKLALASLAVVAAVVACSRVHPTSNPLHDAVDSSDGGVAGAADASDEDAPVGLNVGPKDDPDAACQAQALDAHQDPANLYFVLDRSGSMGDVIAGKIKFWTAVDAAAALVTNVGYRAIVGAAVFPSTKTDVTGCEFGNQVFVPQRGDPKSYAEAGTNGPITAQFRTAISSAGWGGGTPTAATLAALQPSLASMGPHTYVILLTDGGPNCDPSITCSAANCTPNIEQQAGCTPSVNCCDPAVDPHFSPESCLDGNATLTAVSSLAAAGVTVVVVGIPGSEAYASLLDALAVAGGAPRDDNPRYYAVDAAHIDELTSVLLSIGSDVIVSCDITLDSAPSDPSLVDVWFRGPSYGDNGTEIPSDPADGWSFVDATTIRLNGSYCDDLQNGSVDKVDVLFGCPTKMAK